MKRNLFRMLAIALNAFVLITAASIKCETNLSGQYNHQSNDSTKSWFSVKQVADKVWRIDDHGGDNMYLVEGNEKALLIDAGTGVADLAAHFKSITSLPIIVINTHGHPDHCGGDFQFKEVYAHNADFEMISFFCNENAHENAVNRTEDESPELTRFLLSDIDNFKMPALLSIQQGFIFDLGNRSLEVIEVPGHTKGSICLLDKKNKLLFTGDNDNTLVWLFLDGCLPLEQYVQTLQNLKRRSDEFITLLPGHGDPLDREFIDEQSYALRIFFAAIVKENYIKLLLIMLKSVITSEPESHSIRIIYLHTMTERIVIQIKNSNGLHYIFY